MIQRPFFLALRLLTTLPVPEVTDPSEREMGLSVLMYPCVGVVLGVILWGLARGADLWPENLLAAIILFFWLALTGGLHLEGLGDLADAWVGGIGHPERMLEIMKDPRCGPAAVMAISMQILFKFVAIQTLLQQQHSIVLFFAPIMGRTAFLPLMLSTPYLRQGGMAAAAIKGVPKMGGWLVVGAVGLVIAMSGAACIFWAFVTTSLLLVIFRWMIHRRLGGITGDVLGAGCELSETLFLLAALFLPMSCGQ